MGDGSAVRSVITQARSAIFQPDVSAGELAYEFVGPHDGEGHAGERRVARS